MWIAHSSTYEDARVYQLAQTLTALGQSLLELKKFYESLPTQNIPQLKSNEPHPRFFPYPTQFLEGEQTVQFHYLKPLEDNAACVAFLAQTKDNSQVVVKFVDRYGRAVHEFLAKNGYAPRLRYCGPLASLLPPLQKIDSPMVHEPLVQHSNIPTDSSQPAQLGLSFGPLQMVVMDYVKPLSNDLPQIAFGQIQKTLAELHKSGYVFGDLRQPNIILNQANKIQFIDFDWAGRYDVTISDTIPEDIRDLIPAGTLEPTDVVPAKTDTNFAYYPLNLSKNLFSSTGAGDLEPIRPIHDWRMLTKLTFTHD